jgi:hypothetical protein
MTQLSGRIDSLVLSSTPMGSSRPNLRGQICKLDNLARLLVDGLSGGRTVAASI